MTARGMTMIELLASVALLVVLCSVIAAWTTITARAGTGLDKPAHLRNAAVNALELIAHDVATGDWSPAAHGRRVSSTLSETDRVRVQDDTLIIVTRTPMADGLPGPGEYRYRRDGSSGQLIREAYSAQGKIDERVVLTHLVGWDCSVEEPDDGDEAKNSWLTVTLTLEGPDATCTRRYRLP